MNTNAFSSALYGFSFGGKRRIFLDIPNSEVDIRNQDKAKRTTELIETGISARRDRLSAKLGNPENLNSLLEKAKNASPEVVVAGLQVLTDEMNSNDFIEYFNTPDLKPSISYLYNAYLQRATNIIINSTESRVHGKNIVAVDARISNGGETIQAMETLRYRTLNGAELVSHFAQGKGLRADMKSKEFIIGLVNTVNQITNATDTKAKTVEVTMAAPAKTAPNPATLEIDTANTEIAPQAPEQIINAEITKIQNEYSGKNVELIPKEKGENIRKMVNGVIDKSAVEANVKTPKNIDLSKIETLKWNEDSEKTYVYANIKGTEHYMSLGYVNTNTGRFKGENDIKIKTAEKTEAKTQEQATVAPISNTNDANTTGAITVSGAKGENPVVLESKTPKKQDQSQSQSQSQAPKKADDNDANANTTTAPAEAATKGAAESVKIKTVEANEKEVIPKIITILDPKVKTALTDKVGTEKSTPKEKETLKELMIQSIDVATINAIAKGKKLRMNWFTKANDKRTLIIETDISPEDMKAYIKAKKDQ